MECFATRCAPALRQFFRQDKVGYRRLLHCKGACVGAGAGSGGGPRFPHTVASSGPSDPGDREEDHRIKAAQIKADALIRQAQIQADAQVKQARIQRSGLVFVGLAGVAISVSLAYISYAIKSVPNGLMEQIFWLVKKL